MTPRLAALALLPACSLALVRGQSSLGAADCSRSSWTAGADAVLAVGAAALARGEDGPAAYALRAASLYLAASASLGLIRPAQCRAYLRSRGRPAGGGWDWIYVPAVVGGALLLRDIREIRRDADALRDVLR